MKKGSLSEPFIVTIDDLEGSFEVVYWSETKEDAQGFYDELDKEPWQKYPDKQGRHKRMWTLIESSDPTQVTHNSRTQEDQQ